tara:strand:+ start:163 stop:423 length:261 start_codon:yes stop_codon:yes gene_type:complete
MTNTDLTAARDASRAALTARVSVLDGEHDARMVDAINRVKASVELNESIDTARHIYRLATNASMAIRRDATCAATDAHLADMASIG